MRSHTAERVPLVPTEALGLPITVTVVKIAVKKGLQVVVDSPEIANPDAESWFAVTVRYPLGDLTQLPAKDVPYYSHSHTGFYHKKNGAVDSDIILTDCETFYLCRRDLGKTRFVLNPTNRATIVTAISKAF